MSSRIMLDYSSIDSEIITFDLIKWNEFDSHLCKDDFKSRKFTQYLEDLSNNDIFTKHLSLIDKADLIFLDAPKDGVFEYSFPQSIKKNFPQIF